MEDQFSHLGLKELHDVLREVEAMEALYHTNRIVFFKPLQHGDQNRFFEQQR